MIANKYIQQGINIRKNYIKTIKEMETIQNDLESTLKVLSKVKDELDEISKYDSEETNIDNIKTEAIKQLNKVEYEGDKLRKKYEPLNEEIEKLKKQEVILYNSVKEAYPEMEDKDIINEFQKHIKPL